ncbi:hypothetical protein [Reichenbachiella ulvae]|uniref:Uncharacterized protein n=1 Tax=Reichenbachiella ulvae TaxID=2980104 RepID=A0ABT3CU18_9BACT|nr:hypothetical protein [Reichenbachiella ulvae]MCV9387168.1 hypothetical protein [Reichenbachiella ulvae]
MNHSINNLLTTSEMAVINAMHNPQITEALTSFGLQKDSLIKGQKLIEKAQKLNSEVKETQEELKLTHLRNLFLRHTKLARMIFITDENAWAKLGLNGARKQSKKAWLKQAMTFYTTLLNDKKYILSMFRFGVRQDQLIQILSEIGNLENKFKSETMQDESEDRDIAIDELQDWMTEFIETAREALKQNPHQLKALGMEVYAE